MIDTILTVLFVLIAVAMIALILMQRGAGAQAGSGFGSGASATVFGARGSANFLSSSTKWLAVAFFALSLFMAWKAVNVGAPSGADGEAMDAGVMSALPATPETKAPAPQGAIPAIPVPAVPAGATPAPAAAPATGPAVPPAVENTEPAPAG